MTNEERELAITYLESMKESYVEGDAYEQHPLPEYYAIETAIKALEFVGKLHQLRTDYNNYKISQDDRIKAETDLFREVGI